jgi:general secretion pathway protein K
MEVNSGVMLGQYRTERQGVSLGVMVAVGSTARQQGVALAIVVWFIAGMSLLVVGIVSQARVDVRMAQLHVARAKAVAAGDGAIQLMLTERLLTKSSATAGSGLLQDNYQLGESEVSVTLHPAAGFINPNSAPQKVLAALFRTVGQVPEGEANFLADNVIKWRGSLAGTDRKQAWVRRFQSIEDLVQVEGMSRTLFDSMRDYVVVGNRGGTVTDWTIAPEVLLQVLEETNPGEIDAVRRRRDKMTGYSFASAAGEQGTLSGTYRADAVVSYGDQAWLRRRWVSVGSAPESGLPWHFKRTEPPRVYEPSNGLR